MLDLLRVEDYLSVDDDPLRILDLINVSQIYIDKMVGEEYKTDEKMIKLSEELQLKLIVDMYDNKGTEISNKTKKDIIVTSILDVLSNY